MQGLTRPDRRLSGADSTLVAYVVRGLKECGHDVRLFVAPFGELIASNTNVSRNTNASIERPGVP